MIKAEMEQAMRARLKEALSAAAREFCRKHPAVNARIVREAFESATDGAATTWALARYIDGAEE